MKRRLPLKVACLACLGAVLWHCGCSPSASPPPEVEVPAFPRPDPGEFSVMTFNLNQYALVDRDGTAETLEPKPPAEAEILIDVIRQVAPDILAVQEMGDPAAWAEFKFRLRQAGLEYGHEEYLRRGRAELNLAVLSRFPIVHRNSHADDTYTIGPAQFPVMRGIIEVDIQVALEYRFRLMVAHLKSKVFHSFGQAEMRRNEARLLSNHVRDALKENPGINLLVAGDLNDTPRSAPLREIRTYKGNTLLHDLRPVDPLGDAWTHRADDDTCHRIDYMLVSDGMLPEVVPGKTFAVRAPALIRASDHRPLVATFAASERSPESAPDLTQDLPPEMPQND